MKLSSIPCAVLAGLFFANLSVPAHAKTARCEITANDGRYVGPCEFTAGKGGSFDLGLPSQAEDLIFVNFISIEVKSPGVGRVGGTVPGVGRFNDWGVVRRDPAKPACWAGEWGRVCAY